MLLNIIKITISKATIKMNTFVSVPFLFAGKINEPFCFKNATNLITQIFYNNSIKKSFKIFFFYFHVAAKVLKYL